MTWDEAEINIFTFDSKYRKQTELVGMSDVV